MTCNYPVVRICEKLFTVEVLYNHKVNKDDISLNEQITYKHENQHVMVWAGEKTPLVFIEEKVKINNRFT